MFIHHIRGEARVQPPDRAPERMALITMKTSGYKQLAFFLALAFLLLSWPASVHSQESTRKVVKRVEAQYPSILKKRGIGGTVRLRVVVKADGAVKDTEVLGGSAILADSAQKAVKQWVFAPGSAETTIEVSVVFDPTRDSEN
jgi:TonB family protein